MEIVYLAVRTIPLRRSSRVVLVDAADYEWLMRYPWKYHQVQPGQPGYALRRTHQEGRQVTLYMHREIMQAPKGVQVDHKNGDRLDNRRDNLRLATNGQNQWNRHAVLSSSGYKGVFWNPGSKKKWMARIGYQGKPLYIGVYDTPEDAARAYNAKALELFGEYAYLNVIPKEEEL